MRKFGIFTLLLALYFLLNCRMMHLFEDRDFLTDSSTTLVNPDLTTTSLEVTTTTNPNQIEIAGNWFVTNIDLNTSQEGAENGHLYIEDSFISYDYTPSGMTVKGNVIKFDNQSNYLIYQIEFSNDTSSIGKFQKIFWEMIGSDKITISSINYSDTLVSAELDTTIIWGPSKIWSRELITTTTTTIEPSTPTSIVTVTTIVEGGGTTSVVTATSIVYLTTTTVAPVTTIPSTITTVATVTTTTTPVTTIPPSTTTTIPADINVSIVINPSTGYTVTFNPPSGGELNKNIGQALFVVCDITDGGATNFKWLLDGDLKQNGIDNTISVSSNSLFLGLHYLSVIITKDGQNYSGQMEFTVVNR